MNAILGCDLFQFFVGFQIVPQFNPSLRGPEMKGVQGFDVGHEVLRQASFAWDATLRQAWNVCQTLLLTPARWLACWTRRWRKVSSMNSQFSIPRAGGKDAVRSFAQTSLKLGRFCFGFAALRLVLFLGLICNLGIGAEPISFRFSQSFNTDELLTNSIRRADFVYSLMSSLGNGFHQPGVAYHSVLGTTFDGGRFDFFSGRPLGVRKNITAGSKEAIHLSILSACVASNHLARLFVSPDNTNAAPTIATNLIVRKLDAWDDFDQRYPGFGHWLPWMTYQEDRLVPAQNAESASQTWTNRLPALDNGEFVVALLQLEGDLRDAGYASLADRVAGRVADMQSNAVAMFIEPGTNLIRGVVRVAHPELPPTDALQNYSHDDTDTKFFCNDPYEGELMALFLDLFGNWPVLTNREALWEKQRVATNYVVGGTNVTVQQGYHFSSHEEWGFLQWPYMDVPLAAAVFRNGQVARTQFSATSGIPGLLAACHAPLTGNQELVYTNTPGIPQLAQPNQSTNTITNVVTAYGAFPVILADQAVGLTWLDVMLDASKGQAVLGIPDSLAVDGSGVAPVATWDVNGLVALSLIVGTRIEQAGEHPLRRHLVRHGVYDRATMLISNEYAEAFVAFQETTVPLARPGSAVPQLLPDFPATNAPPPGNILAGTPFNGTLSNAFVLTNGTLTLFPSNGFMFTECERFLLQAFPVLHLQVRGSGRFNLELKNPADQLIGPKFGVAVSNTTTSFQSFYCVLPTNVFNPTQEVALTSISDPNDQLAFSTFRFTDVPPTNAQLLQWDGVAFVQDPTEPIELLAPGTRFLPDPTNNQLSQFYTLTNGVLTLPPVLGYIFEFSPLVSLTAKPILTLRARTASSHVFVEVKNTQDKLMTPQKVLVEVPDTGGSFRDFSMDFSQAIEDTNTTLYVFVFSDVSGTPLEILSARFSPEVPVGSQQLLWDGRRFTERLAPGLPPTPFLDLLKYLNFIVQPLDTNFQFLQGGDIHILPGKGYAFTTVPTQVKGQPLAFRLPEQPVLCIIGTSYSPSSEILLELKNSTNGTLFGDTNGIYPKLRLRIIDSTEGLPRLISFDLGPYVNGPVEPKDLRVIAFSDPSAEIRIAGFGFLSSRPQEVPAVRIGTDSTRPWLTWYGGSLEEAPTILGPWTTISNAISPLFPTNQLPMDFWRVRLP